MKKSTVLYNTSFEIHFPSGNVETTEMKKVYGGANLKKALAGLGIAMTKHALYGLSGVQKLQCTTTPLLPVSFAENPSSVFVVVERVGKVEKPKPVKPVKARGKKYQPPKYQSDEEKRRGNIFLGLMVIILVAFYLAFRWLVMAI